MLFNLILRFRQHLFCRLPGKKAYLDRFQYYNVSQFIISTKIKQPDKRSRDSAINPEENGTRLKLII